jgi:hypothetical protein
VHGYVTAALLDDAITGGQPEPGAAAPRGEEGLEDLRQGLGWNAEAVVVDRDRQIGTWRELRVTPGIALFQHQVTRLQQHPPALRQAVASIRDQVEHNLLQLALVGAHVARSLEP